MINPTTGTTYYSLKHRATIEDTLYVEGIPNSIREEKIQKINNKYKPSCSHQKNINQNREDFFVEKIFIIKAPLINRTLIKNEKKEIENHTIADNIEFDEDLAFEKVSFQNSFMDNEIRDDTPQSGSRYSYSSDIELNSEVGHLQSFSDLFIHKKESFT